MISSRCFGLSSMSFLALCNEHSIAHGDHHVRHCVPCILHGHLCRLWHPLGQLMNRKLTGRPFSTDVHQPSSDIPVACDLFLFELFTHTSLHEVLCHRQSLIVLVVTSDGTSPWIPWTLSWDRRTCAQFQDLSLLHSEPLSPSNSRWNFELLFSRPSVEHHPRAPWASSPTFHSSPSWTVSVASHLPLGCILGTLLWTDWTTGMLQFSAQASIWPTCRGYCSTSHGNSLLPAAGSSKTHLPHPEACKWSAGRTSRADASSSLECSSST